MTLYNRTGTDRLKSQDYARFLNIAEASLAETEYLVLLARDLSYLSSTTSGRVLAEVSEISRMLHGLRAKVEEGASRQPFPVDY